MEDVVKYTEILMTPEVVFHSTFSRFLLNKVSWARRPLCIQVLSFSVLTQCRGWLYLFTSIKISIFLLCWQGPFSHTQSHMIVSNETFLPFSTELL